MTSLQTWLVRASTAMAAATFVVPGAISLVEAVQPLTVPVIEGTPLRGNKVETERPALSSKSWLDHEFQPHLESWCSQRFGGRTPLIRATNQVFYSAFQKSYAHGSDIVVGRNGHLYELRAIEEYFRIRRAISVDAVQGFVEKLAIVRDSFTAHHVPLLVVITPHSVAAYPEDVPDGYRHSMRYADRDCDKLVAALRARGIPFLDSRDIVQRTKARDPRHALFPLGGVHWTHLGALETTNALLDSLEDALHVPIPSLRLDSIDEGPPERDESDLALPLNLWDPIPKYAVAHPHVSVQDRQTGNLPTLAIVSNSMAEAPLDLLQEADIFGRIDFYYYYHTKVVSIVGNARETSSKPRLDDGSWKKRFLGVDAVVLMVNEGAPTPDYAQAFLQDAFNELRPRIAELRQLGTAGCSERENDGFRDFYWCASKGTIAIENATSAPIEATLSATFVPAADGQFDLSVEGLVEEHLSIGKGGKSIMKRVVVPPGASALRFSTNAEIVHAPGDARDLAVRIVDLSFSR